MTENQAYLIGIVWFLGGLCSAGYADVLHADHGWHGKEAFALAVICTLLGPLAVVGAAIAGVGWLAWQFGTGARMLYRRAFPKRVSVPEAKVVRR